MPDIRPEGMHTINIARDFSPCPGSRYLEDGVFSGQRFREELLIPALDKYDTVEVELDGTHGLPSSFVEEAFGGLVRVHNYDAMTLIYYKALVLTSSHDHVVPLIHRFIYEADALKRTQNQNRTVKCGLPDA